MFDPAFTLIEDGREWRLADIEAKGGAIDVATTGVAGVIGALKAGDGWMVRDTGVPPPTTDPVGLRSPLPVNGAGEGIHLQTSGTTGAPKWVSHSLDKLVARIKPGTEQARWLLTFNPASFAGIQVILSAMMGGHVLIAPPYGATVGEMAELAMAQQVTHISGTPTFWRAFLMALGERPLELEAVTLGGEAADQAILDALKARFPQARLRHIYATTEAGTVFSVSDGHTGFPAQWLNDNLSISDRDTLTVNGIDTGDVVEIAGNRMLFKGRADSMVNVGGVKVFPETVESHILASPQVQETRVTAKPNPITGAILTADIVWKPSGPHNEAELRAHIAELPRAMRPASLRFVEAIETGATGKKLRI